MQTIRVSIGIVCHPEKELFLVAKRPEDKPYAGMWEFPGGKVEEHETAEQALERELLEEVNILAHSYQHVHQVYHATEQRILQMDAWLVTGFSGQVRGNEQQEICWVDLATIKRLSFPPANGMIIEKLSLLVSKMN